MSKTPFRATPLSHFRTARSRWTIFCLVTAVAIPLTSTGKIAVAADKKSKLPEPEELELKTRDGVLLQVTFYAGTEGKDTVPVILVHSFNGSGSEYNELAPYLQEAGCAVMVPDLRGHGGSTQVKVGARTRTINAASFPNTQFARMVDSDMETVKSYLMGQNNVGKLNIEKLVVVGVEMGASVALDWARQDWSWPRLPAMKQGQDVKALVLISPQWAFRGLQAKPALSHPQVRSELSVLVMVGKGKSSAAKEANRLVSMFKRFHPEPPKNKTAELKDLFYLKFDTTLQGPKLLAAKDLNVKKAIRQFISLRAAEQPYPWKNRRGPLRD